MELYYVVLLGCSKTLIAKVRLNFFNVKVPEIFFKYVVGDS